MKLGDDQLVLLYGGRVSWSDKLSVILSSGDGFQGPVNSSQFMLQGPSTKSHQTLPETRSLLLWLTLVNKGKRVYVSICVCVCVYVPISTFLTLFKPTSPHTEHISRLKVERGNEASAGGLTVCD